MFSGEFVMTSALRVNWACCLALALAAALPLASSRAADRTDKASDTASKTSDKATADKPAVDLFDAMKSGDVEVKYVAKNSREGQLLVKNNTDQPLTVKLPDAFAAVPVLAQAMAAAGGGNRGSRNGYGGNKNNNQNQGTGGGGLGGIGGGIGGGGGGGAFNVAPEKVAKLKIDMVCLEHGKKEPNAHVPYEIRPIEEFTTDVNVQELCKMVSAGKIDQRAAQAAAWHLANHMTWEQLMDKKVHHLLGGDEIYFTEAEIRAAMQLTDRAMKAAESRQQPSIVSTTTTSDTTAASSGRN
jgi:hypothetical protein